MSGVADNKRQVAAASCVCQYKQTLVSADSSTQEFCGLMRRLESRDHANSQGRIMRSRDFATPLVTDLTRQHFRQLDGLRGLAILMVMACHFDLLYRPGGGEGLLSQFAQAGWMGVDLFFVLSGFLITGILLSTRDRQHYFRNFLARRFLRIWPLYYANLIVFFWVIPLLMPTVPGALRSMIDNQEWFWLYGANWLFAIEHGFNHTSGGYFWSLAVEEQFYLVWPFVVYWLSPRALMKVSIGLLCSSLVLRIALAAGGVSLFSLYTITFTHLDGLAVGAILAIGLRSAEGVRRLERALPYVFVVAAAVLILARVQDGSFYYWNRNVVLWGYTAIALLSGCALLWTLRAPPNALITRALSSSPMLMIGRLSYGLYLIHPPVAAFAAASLMPKLARWLPGWSYDARYWLMIAIIVAITWAVALASWHFFEKRILGLKDRFAYEPGSGKQDPAIAAGSAPVTVASLPQPMPVGSAETSR
jgi:peptidoglycan/LPS O-acetylase OafA/YrhL